MSGLEASLVLIACMVGVMAVLGGIVGLAVAWTYRAGHYDPASTLRRGPARLGGPGGGGPPRRCTAGGRGAVECSASSLGGLGRPGPPDMALTCDIESRGRSRLGNHCRLSEHPLKRF